MNERGATARALVHRDALFTALPLLAFVVFSAILGFVPPHHHFALGENGPYAFVGALLGFMMVGLVGIRSAFPKAALCGGVVLGVLHLGLGIMPGIAILGYPALIHAAALRGSTRVSRLALGLGLGGSLALGLFGPGRWNDLASNVIVAGSYSTRVLLWVSASAVVVAAWAIGVAGRRRLEVASSVQATATERRTRLESERAQEIQLAALDERARIAREMHDVISHSLSGVIALADGARYAAAQQPEVAVTALETISDSGRAALADMRSLLGILRSDDQAAVTPQPSIADLPHLIAQVRESGLALTFDVIGPPARLSSAQSLAVYRIIQESLTNVLKHAGDNARCAVAVVVSPTSLEFSVIDNGRGGATLASKPAGHKSGFGLVGMQERAALNHGTVSAGPTPHGFKVEGRFMFQSGVS